MSDVDNIFVFNLLLHLDQSDGDPHRFAHMTLRDFLTKLTSLDGVNYYYDDSAAALVGDAAASVEAFTGEGMTMALCSAVLLAETLRTGEDGGCG